MRKLPIPFDATKVSSAVVCLALGCVLGVAWAKMANPHASDTGKSEDTWSSRRPTAQVTTLKAYAVRNPAGSQVFVPDVPANWR